MTTAFAPTELDAAIWRSSSSAPRVGRPQKYAFRDLIDASQEDLAEAMTNLTAS